MNALNQTQNS